MTIQPRRGRVGIIVASRSLFLCPFVRHPYLCPVLYRKRQNKQRRNNEAREGKDVHTAMQKTQQVLREKEKAVLQVQRAESRKALANQHLSLAQTEFTVAQKIEEQRRIKEASEKRKSEQQQEREAKRANKEEEKRKQQEAREKVKEDQKKKKEEKTTAGRKQLKAAAQEQEEQQGDDEGKEKRKKTEENEGTKKQKARDLKTAVVPGADAAVA